MHEADVLVAPSLGGESFGMVLTEAFASGTPVVASDIAGYREVVRDGTDGVLVRAGDPADLGEALHALAMDPARRARMGAAARERAERYDWSTVSREVMEAYEDAIELHAAQKRAVAASVSPVRERMLLRTGLRPADGRPRIPPRRVPSIEPEAPAEERSRAGRIARKGFVIGGAAAGRRPDLSGAAADRDGLRSSTRLSPRRRSGSSSPARSCACRCWCAPRRGPRSCAPPSRSGRCAAATPRAA